MKVILDGGQVIDLGETDATPTISLSDFSRRETDDFGVTTVVERGFARRMSVKLIVPFGQADAVQRTLANLRAQAVQWVADENSKWLNFRGFYTDFEIDLNVPPVSYCTLTVEGLADTEPFTDPGIDPAPNGDASSLLVLQPATIPGGALVTSSAPEDDYPEWSSTGTYAVGARVIKAATHRIYESGSAGNVGNDPSGVSGKWTDIGPTNRWAMFDQALGSVTSRAGSIAVTLYAGSVNAVALLDVSGASVRVQAAGYDRTIPPNASGTASFLDLPTTNGQVTVTISGAGTVSVGTLLIGKLVSLGSTMDAPKAGITDFSRKETDDFGAVTVVERAWAKRVSLTAMIRTDAIDVVAGRIAAVRATPSLWIGMDGLETITAYGFFKDFQIQRDTAISKLTLSVEGLSTAGKVEPLKASVAWPDITDPLGTKPADNADVTSENTSKDTAAVNGKPSTEITRLQDLNGLNIVKAIARGDAQNAIANAILYIDGNPIGAVLLEVKQQFESDSLSFSQNFELLGARNDAGTGWIINGDSVVVTDGTLEAKSLRSIVVEAGSQKGDITDLKEAIYDETGLTLRASLVLDLDGAITGTYNTITKEYSEFEIYADRFKAVDPNGGQPQAIFSYGEDNVLEIPNARIKNLDVGVVRAINIAPGFSASPRYTSADVAIGASEVVLIETPAFTVGDGLGAGNALATISFAHDGTAVTDTAARIRIYVDRGNGYELERNRLSGSRTDGGDTYWSSHVSIPVALSALGQARIKVTGQGSLLGGGGKTSGSYARDIAVDILRIGR